MPQATGAMHCQGQVGVKAMQRCVRLEGWEETMLRIVSALTYLHNAQTREKGDGLRNEDVAAVAVPQPAKVAPVCPEGGRCERSPPACMHGCIGPWQYIDK